MLRKFQPFLVLLLLASASAAWAQGMKSVASPNEPHGMVITSVDDPANSVFAVNIKNIDGEEIPPFPSGVWLKPGEHEIKGFGLVDSAWTRGRVRGSFDRHRRGLEPLKLTVEEGMSYYVGLQAIGHPSQWKLVVWKEEALDGHQLISK